MSTTYAIKEPLAPASDKQVTLIRILLRQQGMYGEPVGQTVRTAIRTGQLNKATASQVITTLKGQAA